MKEAWIVNVDGRGWCHIMHLADLIMTLGGHRPDGPAVRHVTVWTGWSDQPTEAHERALADAERDGLTLSAVLPIGNSHAVYVFVGREP
jgi:hypothetical protein